MIENRLSTKLVTQGFKIHRQVSAPEDFGSRYTEWRNFRSKYALRLIWDGKEGWFLVDESPFSEPADPTSWADIVIVPLEKSRMMDLAYTSSVADEIINEVK